MKASASATAARWPDREYRQRWFWPAALKAREVLTDDLQHSGPASTIALTVEISSSARITPMIPSTGVAEDVLGGDIADFQLADHRSPLAQRKGR